MKKYKIGYVQGAFDLFHIGHLNILRNAKSICDYLIVGVNTDQLIKDYKNKETVFNELERLEIISHIDFVNEAYLVDNRDKIEALEKYHYDVLIMGDDWKNTPFYIRVEEELKDRNVDVVYFPYTKEISSTTLREKIDFTKKKV